MTSQNPPLPPDITKQQAPPDPTAQGMAFAGNIGAAQGQAAFDVSAFLQATLTEIAVKLGQVGKVIQVSKPDLMPYLEVMSKAGSALMDEVMPQQQPGPNGQDVLMQNPDPKGAPGSVSMG